jgi:hypothetical protein
MSKRIIEQLEVVKHFKMKSELGSIAVHASGTLIGAWLTKSGSPPGEHCAAAYIDNVSGPVIAMYPDAEVINTKYPFAISSHGIQIPHECELPTILSWAEVSKLVKLLAAEKDGT